MQSAVRRLGLLLTLAGAALGCGLTLAGDQAGQLRPWCVTLLAPERTAAQETDEGDAPKSPVPASLWLPEAARYEIDVFGNLAFGRLSFEFTNAGEQELSASMLSARPDGVTLDVFELQSEPGAEQQQLEVKQQKEAKPAPARRGRAARKPQGPPVLVSDTLTVAAGESATLSALFQTTARFRDGLFEVTLPPVGGNCSLAANQASKALGWTAGLSLTVTLRIHQADPLDIVESETHEILWDFDVDHTVVELVAPDPLGDRGFELAYALGRQDEPVASGFVSAMKDGKQEVLVVLAPSLEPPDESIRPKEVLFVMDTSGSMKGDKIIKAREALIYCLELLGHRDLFNLVEFDGKFTLLFEAPNAADGGSLGTAQAWLQSQQAQGSTQLMPALKATFDQQHDPERHRLVVVMTDGALGDKQAVLQLLEQNLGDARLFFVGIGQAPNRQTILELAEYGRGSAAFADDAETFGAAVRELFEEVASPLAWDLRLDLGGAELVKLEPSRLPDLYKGRPVTVRAVVRGELPHELTLDGTTTEGSTSFRVPLPAGSRTDLPSRRSRSD